MTITQEHINDVLGRTYDDVDGCWGLVDIMASKLGLIFPSDQAAALASPFNFGKRVTTPAPGDVAVFRDLETNENHIGMIVDTDRMIHATRLEGVRIDALSTLRMVEFRWFLRLERAS